MTRKLVENFIGTTDNSDTGLGKPYSYNIMTEDTGSDKNVQRILKTVNGQTGTKVSDFSIEVSQIEYELGTIKDAWTYDGYFFLLTDRMLAKCKSTDDWTVASNWTMVLSLLDKAGKPTIFDGKRYKHVQYKDLTFVADFDKNILYCFTAGGTLQQCILPKRQVYDYDAKATVWKEITIADIVCSYGTVFIADKTSNRIYYSYYDFYTIQQEKGTVPNYEHIFDGYWDYDKKEVVVRDNSEGAWFEQSFVDGNMRMLFVLAGDLYGVSTTYTQRYTYSSSTTEPYTPDLKGVIHLRCLDDWGYQLHTEQDDNSFVYAQNDRGFGGLYLFSGASVDKVSTRELDIQFANGNEPTWVTNMRWYPNHKLFGAMMMDNTMGAYSWIVYDVSTKDWHWRKWMPWIQLDGKTAVYSDGNDWRRSSDYMYTLTDSPNGLDIIRQGGAIWNNGDNFIADRCELLTSTVDDETMALVQYSWDDDTSFDSTAEPISMHGQNVKCGIAIGIGRTLTIRLVIGGVTNSMTKPLEIRALKLSYRPANNFLEWL